ncbi:MULTISPECIES: GGDEF domain-containing protein [unclassified Vibrio]|uniref:diguanylate cyclase n=1 Tax=Vibrio sp. HB236076 TaxID=3232307 RepID=A0AB39H979_9VIBR|nr:GGDEF domain-containing protein [Vibrio sp. HB161653]MDP5253442.1 GGDEF domain-containing protein [Vibrio sp. HB161653]
MSMIIRQWFNASINRKISGLFILLLSFLFVVILYSMVRLNTIDKEIRQISTLDIPISHLVTQVEMIQLRQHLLFEKHQLSDAHLDDQTKQALWQKHQIKLLLQQAIGMIRQKLAEEKVTIDAKLHRNVMRELSEYQRKSLQFEDLLIDTIKSRQPSEARLIELEQRAQRLDQEAKRLLNAIQQFTQDAALNTFKQEHQFIWVNGLLGIAAFLSGLYLTFSVIALIKTRIGRLKWKVGHLYQAIDKNKVISSESHDPLGLDDKLECNDDLAELERDLRTLMHRLSVEITSRKAIETQLIQLATLDKLTQIYNRHQWDEHLKQQVSAAQRGQPLSLIILDIDHFKAINDQHGHQVGDQCLIKLASILKQQLRGEEHVYRIGGEEFSVIVPGCEQAKAQVLAERLRASVEAMSFSPAVTISVGLGQYQNGESLENWISRVDRALYQAKHSGRNQTCCAL